MKTFAFARGFLVASKSDGMSARVAQLSDSDPALIGALLHQANVAPELLAALEKMAETSDAASFIRKVSVERAREVIAKAKGGVA